MKITWNKNKLQQYCEMKHRAGKLKRESQANMFLFCFASAGRLTGRVQFLTCKLESCINVVLPQIRFAHHHLTSTNINECRWPLEMGCLTQNKGGRMVICSWCQQWMDHSGKPAMGTLISTGLHSCFTQPQQPPCYPGTARNPEEVPMNLLLQKECNPTGSPIFHESHKCFRGLWIIVL